MHMYVCIYIYIYIYVCILVCICVYIYIYIHLAPATKNMDGPLVYHTLFGMIKYTHRLILTTLPKALRTF